MSTHSHPWLNNSNAKPTSDIGAYRWAARSLGMNTRGVDSKEIRDAVNNQLGIDSDDPMSAMNAFQRLSLSQQGDQSGSSRPNAPFLENNNTSTQFNPLEPVVNAGTSPSGLVSGDSDHPFKVTGLSVSVNSKLFGSITMDSAIPISNLGVSLSGPDIWLTVNFGTWPAVSSATISSGSFPGEIDDTGGADPVQTVARKLIASVSGGAVTQIVNTHLYMTEIIWNGMVVSFPQA